MAGKNGSQTPEGSRSFVQRCIRWLCNKDIIVHNNSGLVVIVNSEMSLACGLIIRSHLQHKDIQIMMIDEQEIRFITRCLLLHILKYSWGHLHWSLKQFASLHQESRNSDVFTCAKFRKCRPLESPRCKLHPQQPRYHLSHGSQHMPLGLNKKPTAGHNSGCPLADCFLKQQCRFLLIDSGLWLLPHQRVDKSSVLSPVYDQSKRLKTIKRISQKE